VRTVTKRLGALRTTYSLKLPSDAGGYGRADAAVLFLPDGVIGALAPDLKAIHGEVEAWLEPPTPALTRPLARGLALAEDPGHENESFGTHRCRVLAQAALRAVGRAGGNEDHLLRALIDGLAAAGVSAARPHLRTATSADYEW
jgi:hypothetical protein